MIATAAVGMKTSRFMPCAVNCGTCAERERYISKTVPPPNPIPAAIPAAKATANKTKFIAEIISPPHKS